MSSGREKEKRSRPKNKPYKRDRFDGGKFKGYVKEEDLEFFEDESTTGDNL